MMLNIFTILHDAKCSSEQCNSFSCVCSWLCPLSLACAEELRISYRRAGSAQAHVSKSKEEWCFCDNVETTVKTTMRQHIFDTYDSLMI